MPDWSHRLQHLTGQTIKSVSVGQDNGYDFIAIITDEGSVVTAIEDGQAGWIKLVTDNNPPQRIMDMGD
jgi:hypothetical protein